MPRAEIAPPAVTNLAGLQASADAWSELLHHYHDADVVARLLRTPLVLKAELVAAEARLRSEGVLIN